MNTSKQILIKLLIFYKF